MATMRPAVESRGSAVSGAIVRAAACRARGRLAAASFTLATSSSPSPTMPLRMSSIGFAT